MSSSEKRVFFIIASLFVGLMLIVSLSGCETLKSQFQQPNVKLASIELVEAGLLQQVYGVTLQVDNPNTFALPIRGVDYAVKLAGQDFATGLTPNAFSIPANSSDQIQVEVRTNLMESLGYLGRLLSNGPQDIEYELSGNIKIDMPFIGAVPFRQKGMIPLTQAYGAQAQ